ncbi:hypothetical protein GLOTRDRAFT_99357 [Gloeophyllum trabeum ATCC 11539]|uniref:Uncharacterized protein n=1 Tax=Gloeophyllum trabeum (strain ATCC 11539 / FP-39264 / Madison 617) TaxID=670483 RepID=S7QBK9_GLOTA|nr:uncharacterized protein GLOTRDRAFT_99357 [Gloeophyllum trabeum ATCC 11539]EPQ57346.1 hypothetical protein GLOTRDRAFT_99357 [Gloeophyllum trabeum ATCC 11539]
MAKASPRNVVASPLLSPLLCTSSISSYARHLYLPSPLGSHAVAYRLGRPHSSPALSRSSTPDPEFSLI